MGAEIALHMYNISFTEFEVNFKNKMRAGAHLPFRQVGAYEKSTPKQIVQAVREVMSKDRVAVMRIMSHGNSGALFFPGLEDYRVISMAYVELRSIFTALGRLEIHGCGVASETDVLKPGANPVRPRRSDSVPGTFSGNKNGRGLVYLKRVASFFNVPTVGAVDAQDLDSWSYKGATVTAFPFNDKFHMDSDGTRTWDFDAQNRAAEKFWQFIMTSYVSKKQFREALRQFKELAERYKNTGAGGRARLILDVEDVEKLLDPMRAD